MTYLRRFANTEQFKVENKIITVCLQSKIVKLVLQLYLLFLFVSLKRYLQITSLKFILILQE